MEHSVVFVNTEYKSRKDQSLVVQSFGPGLLGNTGELKLVGELCRSFLKAGLLATDLGVICVYRYQKKLIKGSSTHVKRHLTFHYGVLSFYNAACLLNFSKEHLCDIPNLEVNTIDQFQGKDKSVILVSFVWTPNTGDNCKQSELLKDGKRINVALTRAKHKLILVGHMGGLKQYAFMARLVNILVRDQILNL